MVLLLPSPNLSLPPHHPTQLDLVTYLITLASLPAERCRLADQPDNISAALKQQYLHPEVFLASGVPPSPTQYTYTLASPDARATNGSLLFSSTNHLAAVPCGTSQAFDNRRLPYRWLPGLPFAPPVPAQIDYLLARLKGGQRIEVMHTSDFWPGPVWLYAARGSGAWWHPGRHVVALNLIDALLRFVPLSEVLAHLDKVRSGDRRRLSH
ncbi:MAG: hypothetical protein SGPRY_005952 [Prymnesium sp.]